MAHFTAPLNATSFPFNFRINVPFFVFISSHTGTNVHQYTNRSEGPLNFVKSTIKNYLLFNCLRAFSTVFQQCMSCTWFFYTSSLNHIQTVVFLYVMENVDRKIRIGQFFIPSRIKVSETSLRITFILSDIF